MFDDNNSTYASFWAIFIQMTVWMQIGFGMTVLNPSAPAFKIYLNQTFIDNYEVQLDSAYLNMMVYVGQCAICFGALIGSLLSYLTVNAVSRRWNLIIIQLLFFISSLLTSVFFAIRSSRVFIFQLGRSMFGLARGMSFSITPVFVAEICDRKSFFFYQGLLTLLADVGMVMGVLLGHPSILGQAQLLQFLFAVPAIFSLAFLIGVPWLPETPAYLVMTGRDSIKSESEVDEASPLVSEPDHQASYRLLRRLRRHNNALEAKEEHRAMLDEIARDNAVQSASLAQILTKPCYRRQLIACVVITALTQASGFSMIFYYSSTLFAANGIDFNMASTYTVGITILVNLYTFGVVPIMKKIGAKRIYIYGSYIALLAQIFLFLVSYFETRMSATLSRDLYIIGAALMALGEAGPKQSFAVLPSELTTHVTRPLVMRVSSVCLYVGAIAVTLGSPLAFDAYGGYAWLIYTSVFFPVILFVQFCVPETLGKTSMEIQSSFARSFFSK